MDVFITIHAIATLLCLFLGYISYLSYIQVEAAYTNPVLNVFIHTLMEQIKVNQQNTATHESRNDFYLQSICIDFKLCLFTAFSGIIKPSGRHYGSTTLMDTDCVGDDVTTNKLARRRWHLMYTLLRNPELIELRKGLFPYTNAAASSKK